MNAVATDDQALVAQWDAWAVENLRSGHNPYDLLDLMVGKGFAPEAACRVLFGARRRLDPSSPYHVGHQSPLADFSRSRVNVGDREVRVALHLNTPVIAIYDNVLSEAECDAIIDLSKDRLEPTNTINYETGKTEYSQYRTAEGVFLAFAENELVDRIEQRVSRLMNWPIRKGDAMQVIRYDVGQEFKPHWDYSPIDNQPSRDNLKTIGQRISTLVMYLSDVEEGGGTTFPKIGLEVTPRKGSALYFEYLKGDGTLDVDTYHAGTPITKGEKWIMTKWAREWERQRS